jgi:mannose-6-phosphate isomerase-like protein (cupin superfamily)
VVEISEGEIIFRREELDVTLLVDVEQLGAVHVRATSGWGKAPLHVHARHAEAMFVFEGELALRLEDRVHRIGADTWAFVPPEVVHAFEVTGNESGRFVVLHAPCSGFGDFVRGSAAAFDQQPPPEYATGDPGLVVLRRAGGGEGETMTGRSEHRRATLLLDSDELAVAEFFYGPGERGAKPHVHHHHADGFLVVEGELTVTVGSGSLQVPAGSLVILPPDVVHGFDNDGSENALFYNLHMPSSRFADYLRGRNPDFDQHDPPPDGGADPATAVAVKLSG